VFFLKRDKVSADPKKLNKDEKESLITKLRDEGGEAFSRGKFDKAISAYQGLIRLEPKSPEHRRKLADCYSKLSQPKEEVEARCWAATFYAESGFLLKAIAMLKLVLVVDPSHQETQRRLAEINTLAGRPASRIARPPVEQTKRKGEAHPTTHSDEERTRATEEAKARVAAVLEARALAKEARKAAKDAAVLDSQKRENARLAEESKTRAPSFSPPEANQPEPRRTASIPQGAALEVVSLESLAPSSGGPMSDGEVYIMDLDSAARAASNVPLPQRLDVEDVLRRTPLFSDLNEQSFMKLVERVGTRHLADGEILFQQGDPADAMYAIVEGEVTASVGHAPPLILATLGEGEFFGEIGLLAEQPRQATIVSVGQTLLLRFERHLVSEMEESEPDFIVVLLRFVRERLVASLMKTSPLFAPFGGSDTGELTERFQFMEVKPRKALVRQGNRSEGVFVLLTGAARVTRSTESAPTELGLLGPGDIFGEMSLMHRKDAIASVITTVKSFALFLPAKDFTELIMMHPAVLDYVSTLASERQEMNLRSRDEGENYFEDRMSLL
jgi:CRP-like cAMP-binding protein